MQALTSDSELDLTPSPAFLSNFSLRSPELRKVYASMRNLAMSVTPPSSSSSSSSSPTVPVHSPPSSSGPKMSLDSSDWPGSCTGDVAAPSDEQLGLRSAVDVAIDNIPIAVKPLALALWKSPDVAVLYGYTRSQAATAVAHALNLHRASGSARVVLIIPRVVSAAKVWQKELIGALDEVKVTTLRSARAPRMACLNALRMEQSPGVVILADKSLKDHDSWNEVRQALKENRVVSRWDIVISEARGGDNTLNLYHSPFRLVADRQARAGMFVCCSDDPVRVRKEYFSKHAVRDFVRTQLPSLSSLSEESIWVSHNSIGHQRSPSASKKVIKSRPKGTAQNVDHLERVAGHLVSELKPTLPAYERAPSNPINENNLTNPMRASTPSQMVRNNKESRNLSLPLHDSCTQKRVVPGSVSLRENHNPSHVRRKPRRSTQMDLERRVLESERVSVVQPCLNRSPRRSLSQGVRSDRIYEQQSVSVVEILEDDESEDEWHTPPSQFIKPRFSSDSGRGSSDSCDDDWKTAFSSRRRSRISRSASVQTKNRKAPFSGASGKRNEAQPVSHLTARNRRTERPLHLVGTGIDSPETPPTTYFLDSEVSARDEITAARKKSSSRRNVFRRRRSSSERLLGVKPNVRRSISVENLLRTDDTATPRTSPSETPQHHKRVPTPSSRRMDYNETPNIRRNVSLVEIPDSDIEVIDIDAEVIDLCIDEDRDVFDKLSATRNAHSRSAAPLVSQESQEFSNRNAVTKRSRQVSTSQIEGGAANIDKHEGDSSDDSSLILLGVTKFNPHTHSLSESERREYNKWLRRAKQAESRGREGYDAAIKLYTKCLHLCDEDNHLISRILSLSHENGILSMKDFDEAGKISPISKRTQPPRRRLRRMCSSGNCTQI